MIGPKMIIQSSKYFEENRFSIFYDIRSPIEKSRYLSVTWNNAKCIFVYIRFHLQSTPYIFGSLKKTIEFRTEDFLKEIQYTATFLQISMKRVLCVDVYET